MLNVWGEFRICLVIFFVLCFNESYSQTIIKPNSTVRITKAWNLEGKKFELPENTILLFDGGYVYNGTLIGNNTLIKGQLDNIFSEVKIDGTWNVPFISTRMFQNLDYDNSLRKRPKMTY